MTPEQKRAYNAECQRRYRERNPGKAAEYAREWRKSHPEAHNAAQKKWQDKNIEYVRAYRRAQYRKHKSKILIRNAKYQRSNREKCRAWNKASYDKNPENAVNSKAKRKRRVGDQKLSRGLRLKLFESQNGICASCPADLFIVGSHMDHIMPLAKGGLHCDSNIQLLCPACNLSKGAKILE